MLDAALSDFNSEPTNQELALGDMADTTAPLNPADFDFAAFLSGVRPTRRSVKLYGHADLLARMDQLADLIDSLPETENVDHLIEEFEELRDRFNNGAWFTVEQRGSEWIKKFREQTAKRLRLKPNEDGEFSTEDALLLLMHQVAAQVIEPTMTYEQFRLLASTNEAEANRLIAAVAVANSQRAEQAGVLTRDFSQRRSG